MAGRRTDVLDVREMVRRFKLAQSNREIAHDMGANRRTVIKYRKVAHDAGWLARSELPDTAEIQECLAKLAPQPINGPESSVEPHRALVIELRKRKVEKMAVWLILKDQHGYTGSYNSVLRFVHRLEPGTPEPCVRVETPPGEEAQVDFGYAGRFVDPATGQLRRAWVFVMTLSFSRHQYAELVFDQSVATWLACHVRAFEFFKGVPGRCVVDNLKAAIAKACFHDPLAQRSYRELAEHYDFTIAPCRPATPEHKGKVESGVHYVKRNALAGRTFKDIREANEHLKQWVLTRAGTRDHGTTHEAPLARFEIEHPALKPLPAHRYELVVWKKAKLHRDTHLVFDKSYYSAPCRLIGQKLLVAATQERVEIYYQHERVATHARARHPGERVSNILHYPPTKVAGAMVGPVRARQQAEAIGTSTLALVERMLADKPMDRLRGAMGVVNLIKRYTPARVEAACRRALFCNVASYRAVESILRQGLENTPLPPEVVSSGPVPKTSQFARPIREIAAGL